MYQLRLYRIISTIAILFAAGNLLGAQESAPQLRYGFTAGKQYAYEVKIQIETEQFDEIREGVLTYAVSSAKENEFVLKPSGSLPAHIKPHPNERMTPRMFPIMGPPIGFLGLGGGGITFNRRGEKIVSRELTPLPYLLGDMELLVFEQFPAEAKSSWEKQLELHVVERESSGPFPRFSFAGRLDSGTHTTAKEQINYTILKSDKDKIDISKKYSLMSIPEEGKASHFEMTGDGQFTFDPGEGVIRSLSMKYEFRENEKNVVRKYPVTLTYHLLSAEELAEHQKKAEQARAEAEKALAPKDFEPGERSRLLLDLKSTDAHRIQTAADRLAMAPADDKPGDISRFLAKLLSNSNGWVQKSAAQALVIWATPDAENALIKASQSKDVFVRNPSIEALGKLKTSKAAEAVAAEMYQQNSRQQASKVLKTMGPVAEDATINLLKDRDEWVRAEACSVLEEIGGKKSLKALRDFVPKDWGFEEINSKKAITAIEKRLGPEADAADPVDAKSKPADTAGPTAGETSAGFRTWRDTSGTFSLEAVMLSQQNGNVVLQKKDGTTLRVPVAKLSPADKKYIAEHAAETPSKAENPFE